MTQPSTNHHVRELRCPACNRYLGAVALPASVRSGDMWQTLRCRDCRKWVRIDPAKGRVREEREKVPA